MRLVPNSALSAASAGDGPSSAPCGRLPAREGDVDLGDLVVAELEVADAAAVVVRGLAGAADERADAVGHDRGLAFGEHARLRRADAGDVADRVDAGEPGLERAAGRPGSSRRPSCPIPRRPPARGAPARRGTGRRASRCRRRASPPAGPGRARARASAGARRSRARRTRRAAPSTRRATAGSDTGNGMTSAISDRSRSPRSVRKSCISSAVSLGAGGHLNGVEVTPTITRPPSKSASTSRSANAPAHRVELVAALDEARASPPGGGRRRARRPGCRRRRCPRRSRPASASGSIDADRRPARTARPGLTMSP